MSLTAGALLGQGAMLLTSAVLVAVENPLAGVITTALGISSLLLVLVDWGGQVIQRQAGSSLREINPYEFVVARCPALVGVVAAVFWFPSAVFGGTEVSDFLMLSSVGFVFAIFNMSGLLDVSVQEVRHGLIAGLNSLVVAIYVLCCIWVGKDINMSIAAALNGVALVVVAMTTFKWFSQANTNRATSFSTKRAVFIFKQGLLVSFSAVAGQLISRAISVILLLNFHGQEAARFNFMKSFSGIFTQLVVLSRRAEFKNAHDQIISAETLRFLNYGPQKKSIFLGVFALIFGGMFLLVAMNSLHLPKLLVAALLVHSTLWLFVSSYFNHYQITSKNWIAPIHAGLALVTVYVALYFANLSSAAFGLVLEFSASFFVFIVIYVIDRVRR